MAYKIEFAEEVDAHLEALTAGQKARVFDAIERVIVVAIGVKVRERVLIAGKEVER
jgi:hypothetical protein